MKKIGYIFCLTGLLLTFQELKSQDNTNQCGTLCGSNLFPNPGFEVYTTLCTSAKNSEDGEIYIGASPVKDWTGLSKKMQPVVGGCIRAISADYWNSTCAGGTHATNNCGDGQGSVGFFTGMPIPDPGEPNSGLEYVQAKLNEKLKINTQYCVSVKVRTFGEKSDGLGMWFHNKGQLDINSMNNCKDYIGQGSLINAAPQFENKPGNMFDQNCKTISGTFTANGTEEWVVIGNFKKSVDTKYDFSGSSAPMDKGYLIIDEVSLIEICKTTGLIENINGFPFEVVSIINKSVSLKINTELNPKEYSLQVFNAEGKLISDKSTFSADGKSNLNLSAYSSGLYFISLSKNSSVLFTQKVILNEE